MKYSVSSGTLRHFAQLNKQLGSNKQDNNKTNMTTKTISK